MPRLSVYDVFTPNGFPAHTYVPRENYENALQKAFAGRGALLSIAGPSKSGKSVLCERILSKKQMVPVSGSQVKTPADLWSLASAQLGLAATSSTTSSSEGGMNVAVVSTRSSSNKTETRVANAMRAVTKRLVESKRVLVVDDFHYVLEDVQRSLSEQIKEASAQGLRAAILSVHYRGDDAIRRNPDLRGRVRRIDLPFWRNDQLAEIARLGLDALNVSIDAKVMLRLAVESLSSPQLMQALCQHVCLHYGVDERQKRLTAFDVTEDDIQTILSTTVPVADCTTAFEILRDGPLRRGQTRRKFPIQSGEELDVYQLILRGASTDPPRLELTYEDVKSRIELLVVDEGPSGTTIQRALSAINKLISERLANDRVLEWDKDKLRVHFPDPHFLFFLRQIQTS